MDKIRQQLEQFAIKHKLILEDHGEVGFGRPCVGYIKGNGYVDYNPHLPLTDDFEFPPVFPDDDIYRPPYGDGVKDAYHKHDCLAVLVHDDDYNEALRQLAIWVDDLEARGVYVAEYHTGAQGLQALLTGLIGYAIRFKE
jgi:hypothetical protein